MAFVLQCIVYINNAIYCSGNRLFAVYEEPLKSLYYIRYIFALSVSLVLSCYGYYSVTFSTGICQLYLYFQTEAIFRLDRSNSMTL